MILRVLQCGLLLYVFMDTAKALVVCVFHTMSPGLSSEKIPIIEPSRNGIKYQYKLYMAVLRH
jgi:hypothetical protein